MRRNIRLVASAQRPGMDQIIWCVASEAEVERHMKENCFVQKEWRTNMRNFTKKLVAGSTAVLMSVSVFAGTALAAGSTTSAQQALINTVTSVKETRPAFNAKAVARNAAKTTKTAGNTATLTANQIVTNVLTIKGSGSSTTTTNTTSKATASQAAAAAANAAYTGAASAIGDPDLTQTVGAVFGPYVPEGAYTNQVAPTIDYTTINVPGPDGQVSDGNAQDW